MGAVAACGLVEPDDVVVVFAVVEPDAFELSFALL